MGVITTARTHNLQSNQLRMLPAIKRKFLGKDTLVLKRLAPSVLDLLRAPETVHDQALFLWQVRVIHMKHPRV